MASYKGISFAKGYNRSFADFKNDFESTHVFKAVPRNKRDSELKKAYKIALNGALSGNSKESVKGNATKSK